MHILCACYKITAVQICLHCGVDRAKSGSLSPSITEQVFVAVYKTTPPQSLSGLLSQPASFCNCQLRQTFQGQRLPGTQHASNHLKKKEANGMVCTSWHVDAYTQHRCTERKRSLKRRSSGHREKHNRKTVE